MLYYIDYIIYIYNMRHENDLTPSQRTTQFYFSVTLNTLCEQEHKFESLEKYIM